jgi:predicted dehydrogenase/threonine dehydrogenase-like Zn-dependent dehydrogenase
VKQLLHSTRSGEATVAELPVPALQPGMVLVQNRSSLVSAGTERTLVDFSEKNLLAKAQARPDLVRQVLDKVQRDGLLTTIDTVRTRLDTAMALGYSSAGLVMGVGQGVTEFKTGDRVACAGFGYAVHAEVVAVPKNLVTVIPDGVGFTDAAFTTLGAIALQGIRQASPQLGDNVAVIGLGLLGQLTIQMLKANGCRVFGVDVDPQRVALALEIGADIAVQRQEATAAGRQFSSHHGFDSILITADTKSDDPLILAGELARDKGVVVAVGAVGMQVPRASYYNKELDLRLSRSYGPGRYDRLYEEQGIDYPYGYVRWTENRNMQAFLNLIATAQVNVQRLISHCFPIEQAQQAYDVITGKVAEPFLGVLLTYSDEPDKRNRLELLPTSTAAPSGTAVRIGVIGAGAFANSVLIPAMRQTNGLHLRGLCTSTGASSTHSGRRFGFEYACTDESHILDDADTDLVVVATPHHLHAGQVTASLERGKHVFCEKPLCLTEDELQAIVTAYMAAGDRHLMVGFNRRFAPLAIKLKDFIVSIHEPLLLHYRINGGYVPLDHWIQNLHEGGGRIIGEICHFVDFFNFLTNQPPVTLYTRALPNNGRYADDNLVLVLTYPDGTVGTITYAANGDKSAGKERIEVFGGGQTAILKDFRHLSLTRNGKTSQHRLRLQQDKGHKGEWAALIDALRTGQPTPIAFDDIVSTTRITLEAVQSLRDGQPVTFEK